MTNRGITPGSRLARLSAHQLLQRRGVQRAYGRREARETQLERAQSVLHPRWTIVLSRRRERAVLRGRGVSDKARDTVRLALSVLCLLVVGLACQSAPTMDEAADPAPSQVARGREPIEQQQPVIEPDNQTLSADEVPASDDTPASDETPDSEEASSAPADGTPAAIDGLRLSSPARGVLVIEWNPLQEEPSDYWVSWTRADADFHPPTDPDGNAYVTETSHTVGGLEPGAMYRARVRARQRQTDEPGSISIGPSGRSATTRIIAPPAAPTGLTAVATHAGVILVWDEQQDQNIDQFVLVRRHPVTRARHRRHIHGHETSYRDFTVEPETEYAYTLAAVNPEGEGPPSNSVSVATPERLVGREYLYQEVSMPRSPAFAAWIWDSGRQGLRELEIEFTIGNDPGDWSNDNGYYLMLVFGYISDIAFYFGVQTDTSHSHSDLVQPDRADGKGAIFSRWDVRDLNLARFDPEEGWTQSSGHEGDFIGVRRAYDWTIGTYRARLSAVETDTDGEWFSLWLTNLGTDVTTWIGSLKFPFVDGSAVLYPDIISTVELYGEAVAPIHNPPWHVSVRRPIGDGSHATRVVTFYAEPHTDNVMLNSNVRFDPESEQANFMIGADTERQDPPGRYALD